MTSQEELRVLGMVYDTTGLDGVILALRDGLRSGQVMSIDVADHGGGERVELAVG